MQSQRRWRHEYLSPYSCFSVHLSRVTARLRRGGWSGPHPEPKVFIGFQSENEDFRLPHAVCSVFGKLTAGVCGVRGRES